ncbi:ROK family transcriptional regulator [Paenibacillus mesophilus]|uniref:ROK family transcriptional regulator n=1 Tax=Paenibacillus mesophilus TaxID=2582849 RepID=UPI00110DF80A|nr:ROK family transcriptional regulator [Paenibacillus mesophilus]TMV52108.1 ROK family transcriptional regulator [Paenibacillus mesophilus]
MPNLEEWIPNRKAKQILAEIRKRGIVSKFDLLDLSGLTSSTLTRMLEELTSTGWIEESGLGESSGGRRPLLYRLKQDRGFVLGLDVSRSTTRLVLCDLQLEKIDSASWQMTERMTPDLLLQEVVRATRKMLAKHSIDPDKLLGMGIGAVGPVDRTKGIMLNPLYFPAEGWNQVQIGPRLERELGVSVLLDNGANTALLAEYWAGSQQYRHLLYVRAGVGLRSAMMSNGQLVYGAVDMEGSVGHMIIQTDGPPHPERPHVFGCLESFVSIPVLEKQAAVRLKQGRRSVLTEWVDNPDHVGFPHLLKALSADDRLVTELFTQAATYFGIGLSNLLNILHPEKVILGGPLITTNELFYQISTQTALKNTLYYPAYPVTFTRGKLSDDALAVGAAAMVIDRLTS